MRRNAFWWWTVQATVWVATAWAVGAGTVGLAEEDAPAKPKRPLALEVELTRGPEVSRLRVYLRNHTDRNIAFQTGAQGGPGSLNDQVLERPAGERPANVIGTAPTVLPVFQFGLGNARITFMPPAISGFTRRAMRPAQMTIPAGTRVMYASFAVPSAHVAGPFVLCQLALRGEENAPEPDVIGRWEMRLQTDHLREVETK